MANWAFPFPDSALTGHFGKVRTFNNAPTTPHRGTDWSPAGSNKGKTVIPNITPGKVALIQWSNVLGWVVVIEADDKTWFVGYCHLSCVKHGIDCKGPAVHGDHSPLKSTKVGQHKALGEPVGVIGNTGSASSGSHLHATLSKTLKGVFSGTVYDLYKHITEMTHEHKCECGATWKD